MPRTRKPQKTTPSRTGGRSWALTGGRRPSTFRTPSQRAAANAQKARPTVAQISSAPKENVTLPFGNGVTMSRRDFLLGAVGVGAAAAVVAGVALAGGSNEEASESDGISVPESSVSNIDDFEEVSRDDCFTLIGDYELPFGTLLWANNGNVAACLIPTDQASPIAQVALLMIGTGSYFTVLEQAAGASEGYEILDARASESGLVWTEENVMEGAWRILCATLSSDGTLGDSRVVEQGDKTYETPTIAAVGDNAYWQVVPVSTTEDLRHTPSYLKRAPFAQGDPVVLHEAVGRMSCPLYASDAGVVIAAHDPDSYSNYDLLYFDDASGKQADKLTLPSGMAPNALGYGPNGISFCFENIYDYGDGISNLGTYTPTAAHQAGTTYDGMNWFRFGRTPQSGPCWCGSRWFMVKSTTTVCGVDMATQQFCSLDVASGCTDWGDYLATSGAGDTVVTIMQIDQVNTSGETEHHAQVRVWQALADGESAPVDEDNDGYDDNTGEIIEAGTSTDA